MKRRVLIITNAGKVGASNYCDGVLKDKENYVSFFTSAYGGYFSNSEIKVLNKPPNERFCVIAAVSPQIMQWKLASYYPAESSVEAATTQSRHHVARHMTRNIKIKRQ